MPGCGTISILLCLKIIGGWEIMKIIAGSRFKIIIISLVFIIVISLYNMFSIFIDQFIGRFTVMLLFLMALFFVGTIVFTLFKIFSNHEHIFIILALSSVLSLYLLFTQTFRFIGIKIDYYANNAGRTKIVDMFEKGTLAYHETDWYASLPEEYSYLSKPNGRIMIDDRNSFKVCFFIGGDVYSKHEVVVYVSDNGSLKSGDFGDKVFNIKKLKEHWYSGRIKDE